MKRLFACLGLAAIFVVGTAAPAFAHAALEDSDPSASAVLATAPRRVVLTFSEPVEASLGAVRLFNSRAHRLEVGSPRHPGGQGAVVDVALPSLARGSYIVTWRVLSADAHPVSGAFTFSVGSPSARDVRGLAQRLLATEGGSNTVGVGFAVVRVVVFAGLAVLLGGVAFLVLVWTQGRASRVARRVVWWGWWATLIATIAGIALQGPYAAGLGLGDTFEPSLWNDVLHTRFGQVSASRIVILLLGGVVLRTLFAARSLPRWWYVSAALGGAWLAATPGLGGHAASGDWIPLSIPADVVHVAAMAVWLGGLVMLTVAVLPRRDEAELRAVVPRFSSLAFPMVVAIVATGVYQSWRQVGSIDALVNTDYGQLLIAKVAVFSVLVIFAAMSRDAVHQRWHAAPLDVPETQADDAWTETDEQEYQLRRLRRAVGAEVLIAVVVLAVTALLVNAAPARLAVHGPFFTTVTKDKLRVDVVVSPARSGLNAVHVTALTAEGNPAETPEMNVAMSLPSKGIAPIAVPLRRLSPGHYIAPRFDIPANGQWTMTITALVTEFDQATITISIPIR